MTKRPRTSDQRSKFKSTLLLSCILKHCFFGSRITNRTLFLEAKHLYNLLCHSLTHSVRHAIFLTLITIYIEKSYLPWLFFNMTPQRPPNDLWPLIKAQKFNYILLPFAKMYYEIKDFKYDMDRWFEATKWPQINSEKFKSILLQWFIGIKI